MRMISSGVASGRRLRSPRMCASTTGRCTESTRSIARCIVGELLVRAESSLRAMDPPYATLGDAVLLVVRGEHVVDARVELQHTLVEIQPARAEPPKVLLVVRDEEQRAAAGEQLLDAAVALLAERLVANGEHLVDEDDRLL